MDLKAQLQEDMKAAMRAQDKLRLAAIRLILAAVKQVEVDERIAVDDARLLTILDKMVKQRRDSISQYELAKRQDLIDQEQFELGVIQQYLPTPLTDAEIDTLISRAIQEVAASSIKDMGKVMAVLKPKVQGRADIAAVGARVKQQLPN